MILDRSNWSYSPLDLHNEWTRKAHQFRSLISDFGSRFETLTPLIRLVEHISKSEISYHLFPGEKLNELIINTTIDGKVDDRYCLKIQLMLDDPEKIEMSYFKKGKDSQNSIVWNFICNQYDLIETFDTFISANVEFKGTNS